MAHRMMNQLAYLSRSHGDLLNEACLMSLRSQNVEYKP